MQQVAVNRTGATMYGLGALVAGGGFCALPAMPKVLAVIVVIAGLVVHAHGRGRLHGPAPRALEAASAAVIGAGMIWSALGSTFSAYAAIVVAVFVLYGCVVRFRRRPALADRLITGLATLLAVSVIAQAIVTLS